MVTENWSCKPSRKAPTPKNTLRVGSRIAVSFAQFDHTTKQWESGDSAHVGAIGLALEPLAW